VQVSGSVLQVRLLPLIALPALVLLGAACGGSGGPGGTPGQVVTVTKTVFTTPGKSVPVPADGPLTVSGYRAITAGLRKLLGRDPLLLQVGLYESYAYFRVYDRSTGFADDYNWRNGVFDPPAPYKIGSTDVPRSLFALEEIAPDGPSSFVRNMAAIELDGAGDDSPSVNISRAYSSSEDELGAVVMRSGIDGTRQYLSVTGDSRGRIIERNYS
jgi:hypothetical protein